MNLSCMNILINEQVYVTGKYIRHCIKKPWYSKRKCPYEYQYLKHSITSKWTSHKDQWYIRGNASII